MILMWGRPWRYFFAMYFNANALDYYSREEIHRDETVSLMYKNGKCM